MCEHFCPSLSLVHCSVRSLSNLQIPTVKFWKLVFVSPLLLLQRLRLVLVYLYQDALPLFVQASNPVFLLPDQLPTLRPPLLDFLKVGTTFAVACENIRFSSLFAAGDVSRGETSATQRQKFHTDDANQCLLNKFGSRGVPDVNLFNFRFLLVDFCRVLCSSANELQQNSNAGSRKDYIREILTVLLEIYCVYI